MYFLGNIVSIRVTSVDDHIVDQIDFSKASLDTDTSETADQSRDQGFKSADQRKPVKLSLKVIYFLNFLFFYSERFELTKIL